jgi:thiamine-phosphate pyrophosphorylase
MRGFYFVTDRRLARMPEEDQVRLAIDAGASIIQFRDKELMVDQKISLARKLRLQCSGRAIFIVNDDVEVAQTVDADGVHLGKDDMTLKTARYLLGKDKLIGVSVRSVEEAKAADQAGADYVAVGPIFATTTKKDAGEPVGIQMLKDVKASVHMPVAAIGGINEKNVDSVIAAGADMVCAISATAGKDDLKGAVRFFAEKFRRK